MDSSGPKELNDVGYAMRGFQAMNAPQAMIE